MYDSGVTLQKICESQLKILASLKTALQTRAGVIPASQTTQTSHATHAPAPTQADDNKERVPSDLIDAREVDSESEEEQLSDEESPLVTHKSIK